MGKARTTIKHPLYFLLTSAKAPITPISKATSLPTTLMTVKAPTT